MIQSGGTGGDASTRVHHGRLYRLILFRADAQLTLAVPPPAVRHSIRREGTGVVITRAHHTEGSDGGHRRWDATVVGGTIAQLAGAVLTPTEEAVVNGDGAGVL